MTPTCAQCKRVIPDVDINVASDVAFCRACNVAHKLSSLVHGMQLDGLDLGHPPSGSWRHSSGMGAEIGATHRSVGTALGALAFGLFWNGIVSVFVLVALSATLHNLHISIPDWFPAPKMNGDQIGVGMTIFLWIFLTPFITVGAIMIGTFLSAIAGRTEVEVRQSEGSVFTGIGPLGWRRRFNAGTVVDVRIENRSWRNSDGDHRNKTQIVIEGQDGRQLKFGTLLREDRMKFVAAALRKALLG